MSKKKKKNQVDTKAEAQTIEEIAESIDDTPIAEPPAPLTPEQERDELLGRLQRLAADYQNYQKRALKEQAQSRDFANEAIMKDLVSVLDDMERALAAAEENHGADDPFYTGMQMVHDNLLGVLKKFGLEPIDPLGQPFDPELHSALMQQPTDNADPMTILQVAQRGYILKGRTLRPAGVVVAKPLDEE